MEKAEAKSEILEAQNEPRTVMSVHPQNRHTVVGYLLATALLVGFAGIRIGPAPLNWGGDFCKRPRLGEIANT
jgi:hypothetical protein